MSDLTKVDNFNYNETTKIFKDAQDFLPLLGTDHVELYVGNAKQAAHFYKTALGFQELAYAGLETGSRDRTSYVLQQGKIRIVLTSPFDPDSEISHHIRMHGDGVKVIALTVNDAYDAFEQTTKRGAKAFMQPNEIKDENGVIRMSGIHTYGDTVHVFVERKNYSGLFMPGYVEWKTEYNPGWTGLKYIDHMVGNVSLGEMIYSLDEQGDDEWKWLCEVSNQ
jgi:4-hydroxyphenylpyruvate dioxygenase